ncbi:hypothetical protein TNCV_2341601 [Trichonephila clavipes]|uniref:Uncharacterized protein n=1 Tax=Trichonephila clavipes TaxID=2585209 RepID=A0A8X6R698_TRICX|nr:hypothetical protein TNCV_2341601 [Trichonephila clavipes]
MQLKLPYCPVMCDTVLLQPRYRSSLFSKDMNSVMIFMLTDCLFNGLLYKAVSPSATFIFTMDALPVHFLYATDPVSRNRSTERDIAHAFDAVSPGYFC